MVVNGRTSTFSFAMDALDIAAQLNQEFIPALKEDKVSAVGVAGLVCSLDGGSLQTATDSLV